MHKLNFIILIFSLVIILLVIFFSFRISNNNEGLIIIDKQGSFTIGGSVDVDEEGKTIHGDHAYVFYQQPLHSKKYPLVFLHGIFQYTKTWETTPDGREGFQNIFLRKGYTTYNMTLPRRAQAGRGLSSFDYVPLYDEQSWFTKWRIGVYPDYFDGVQFPKDSASLDNFFRQITPNIGPIDFNINTDAIALLFEKLDGAIMVAHSHGGTHTWLTVPKTDKIKGIVAWETGGLFPFPDDREKPVIEGNYEGEYMLVNPEDFKKYTEIPTLLIYGDNIPSDKSDIPELDIWRIRLSLAKQWAKEVNQRGGDVTVIHLPEIGRAHV